MISKFSPNRLVVDLGGNRAWYQNSVCHRLDGPAIEWADGTKSWRIDGVLITEEDFNENPMVIMHRFINGKE